MPKLQAHAQHNSASWIASSSFNLASKYALDCKFPG